MKKILLIAGLAFFAASCGNKSKSVNAVVLGKSYGPVKVDTSKSVSVSNMLKKFEGQKEEMEFTFFAPSTNNAPPLIFPLADI